MSSHDLDSSENIHGTDRKRLVKGQGANWMDTQRKDLAAYEYLCRIGEAKQWIEAVTKIELPAIVDLEQALRNGVILAKLSKAFEPTVVKKIFDENSELKLQYRHSDNINYFFNMMKKVGLPDIFIFELTDLYEKRNIPKVIYCIHALSYFLYKHGRGPKIANLLGQLEFTEDELSKTQKDLDESGLPLPQFHSVGDAVAKEMKEEIPQETEEEKRRKFLEANRDKIVLMQAVARGRAARLEYQERLRAIRAAEPGLIKFQALLRGHLARQALAKRKAELDAAQDVIRKLQAHIRGYLARRNYKETKDYYARNLDKIVKIQSLFRGKVAEDAYKALTEDSNPPLSALQNFLHLLDDSDKDFDEELELERLRQLIVKLIRENQQREQHLGEMDLKIALLVRNRISIDDVIKTTKSYSRKKKKEEGAEVDPEVEWLSLKSLHNKSRSRLEGYSHLFYLLQTQPNYLAKLLYEMKASSKVQNFIQTVVLTLFGYAQNPREEYLLLKLFKESVKEEMGNLDSVADYSKADSLMVKLFLTYARGAKDQQYYKELLKPLVKKLLETPDLDLETEPQMIYKNLIKEEELQTGQKSTLPPNAPRDEMLNNPKVRERFIKHLQQLRNITDEWNNAIIDSLKKVPYGVRYILKELREALTQRFPEEEEEKIIKALGFIFYYRYLNPIIVQPDAWDVVEKDTVSDKMMRNLTEVSKMLQAISVNKHFTEESVWLQPLNEYISIVKDKFSNFMRDLTKIDSLEDNFQIDEYADVSKTTKPVVYISPVEIINTHALLLEHLDHILPNKEEDPLRTILNEIGVPPAVDLDSLKSKTQGFEMSITLTNKFAVQDATEDSASLFVEAKRYVLILIKIQSGKTLLDILNTPVTEKEEVLFSEYQRKETKRESTRELKAGDGHKKSLPELLSTSFKEIKERVQSNLDKLEERKLVSKENNYQDMLNAIAKDIRNKHRRRIQRRTELKKLRQTLSGLEAKSVYLDDQKNSYDEYIKTCMSNLTKKSGKKAPRLLSRQYFFERELKKQGKVPEFGSFKYTAEDLHKRGVVQEIIGISPKQYDKITIVISSSESGVFNVEASRFGVSQSVEVKLEELLQAQFDGKGEIKLNDQVIVNVNLLLYLINRKFYK